MYVHVIWMQKTTLDSLLMYWPPPIDFKIASFTDLVHIEHAKLAADRGAPATSLSLICHNFDYKFYAPCLSFFYMSYLGSKSGLWSFRCKNFMDGALSPSLSKSSKTMKRPAFISLPHVLFWFICLSTLPPSLFQVQSQLETTFLYFNDAIKGLKTNKLSNYPPKQWKERERNNKKPGLQLME